MHRIASFAVVAALWGCTSENNFFTDPDVQPSDEPRPVEGTEVTDIIIQTVTPTVDVLYMVDNSCSMSDDQAALAENFPTFMRWFLGSGLDYHIGVVSSDMVDPTHRGKLQAGFGKKWIDNDDNNQIAQFTQMAVLGSSGAFPERGTAGVFFSQEDSDAISFNDGFFRDTSAIHTIAVSDERDYSQAQGDVNLNEFINWYDGLKRNADERTFSAIEDPNARSYVSGGRFYAEVTEVIGGVTWDVKSDNWARALDELGLRATGRKTEYFLSQLPVDATIDVTVRTPLEGDAFNEATYPRAFWSNGELFLEDGSPAEGSVWYYVEGRNSITFVEFVPGDLAEVVITYNARSTGFEIVDEEVDKEEPGEE